MAGLPLITPRLRLRPLTEPDAAPLRALVTRPEVGRNLFVFPPDWGLAAARDFIADWAFTGPPRFRLAIEGREGGFLGTIGTEGGEVFYALAPEAAGQGLATEALTAFAAHLLSAFPELLGFTAQVFSDNPASERVLDACGFTRTGSARHASAARPAPDEVSLWHRPRTPSLPETLQAPRLTLRPMCEADGPLWLAALRAPEVHEQLASYALPISEADFAQALTPPAEGRTWAIAREGQMIGRIYLRPIGFGYWLAPEVHRQGFGTEAARAVLSAHFARSRAPVTASAFSDNPASCALLRRFGFRPFAQGPLLCRSTGLTRPSTDFRLNARDFHAA